MRKDGFSIRTLNAALTALVTILNFAVDRKYIDSRPRIGRLKRAEQPPKFFTEEEMGRYGKSRRTSQCVLPRDGRQSGQGLVEPR